MVEVSPADADAIDRQRTMPLKLGRAAPMPEAATDELSTIANAAIQAASTDDVAGAMVLLRTLIHIVRQYPDGQRRLDEVAHGLRLHGYDDAAAIIETE
jgi:hypothetical protein